MTDRRTDVLYNVCIAFLTVIAAASAFCYGQLNLSHCSYLFYRQIIQSALSPVKKGTVQPFLGSFVLSQQFLQFFIQFPEHSLVVKAVDHVSDLEYFLIGKSIITGNVPELV